MLQAAAEGNDTLVRQLLAQGAPGNQRDERGATALMIAARNGDLGMMQALLSRGADAIAHRQPGTERLRVGRAVADDRQVRRRHF